jgi:hypothetical protein
MGASRKKDDQLSQTAKTYIELLVKQMVFNYHTEIDSKYLSKGIMVEDQSIDLYNEVFFTNYKKNDVRLSNDFIQGECDINADEKIIDIKSSWSKDTFIATPDEIDSKEYEWQLRGYMWLYNKDFAELAYCLVDTPDSLLEWEKNLSIHQCSEIAPHLRVTIKQFERDISKEDEIIEKVKACREYAKEYEQKIINK